jgi:hypothetical protein
VGSKVGSTHYDQAIKFVHPGGRPNSICTENWVHIITDQPSDEKQRWIELRVPKAGRESFLRMRTKRIGRL